MRVGGRVHVDVNVLEADDLATFGSARLRHPDASEMFFRRVRLNLTGTLWGWDFHIAPDFAQAPPDNRPLSACAPLCRRDEPLALLYEAYVSHSIGPGRLFLGQIIPFRSLEDQTSSNELTMIEGAISGASGVYRGGFNRLYQLGLGYLFSPTPQTTLGLSGFNLRRDGTPSTDGFGASIRGTWHLTSRSDSLLHLGASATIEDPDAESRATNVGTAFSYAGVLGPTAILGTTEEGDRAIYSAIELAGRVGPTVVQSEFVTVSYGQGRSEGMNRVDVLHVSVSHALTGEAKPYDHTRGTFGNVRPRNVLGALEVTARLEYGQSRDARSIDGVRQIRSTSAGLNWYLTPHFRLMANYVWGRATRVDGAIDRPRAFAARLQVTW